MALNNLQWLRCHKTQPNQTKAISYMGTSWIGLQTRLASMLQKHIMCMYLPNPSTTSQLWHEVSFKAKFSFSQTSCHTKVKEIQFALPFTHSWRKNSWIYTFLKGISTMWNVNQHNSRFELKSLCPFPVIITIMPW